MNNKFQFVCPDNLTVRDITREEAVVLIGTTFTPVDYHLDRLEQGKCECLSVKGGLIQVSSIK